MILEEHLWVNKKSTVFYVQYAIGVYDHILAVEYTRLFSTWINFYVEIFSLGEDISLHLGKFYFSWTPSISMRQWIERIATNAQYGLWGDRVEGKLILRWKWGTRDD